MYLKGVSIMDLSFKKLIEIIKNDKFSNKDKCSNKDEDCHEKQICFDNFYYNKNKIKTYSIDEIRAYKDLLVKYNQNILNRARKKLFKLCMAMDIIFIFVSLVLKVPIVISVVVAFTIILYFVTNRYMIRVFNICNEKKRFLNRS
jgi:hypothetical protein